jgi:hypothetical protein
MGEDALAGETTAADPLALLGHDTDSPKGEERRWDGEETRRCQSRGANP